VDKASQPIVNKVISGNRTLSVTILIDDSSPGNNTADTKKFEENIQGSRNLKQNHSASKVTLPDSEVNLPAFRVEESKTEDGILTISNTNVLPKAYEQDTENLESLTKTTESFYSSKEDGKTSTCFYSLSLGKK
jgi:hypothetical protein